MIVTETSVVASFYDIFWVVLADIDNGSEIAVDIDSLGLLNVGVAVLPSDGSRKIIGHPSGPPVPDRRGALSF